MKETVKVAAVQMDVKSLDAEANLANIRDKMDKITAEGPVDLVVFPELADIGYVKARGHKDYLNFAKEYVRAAQSIPGPFTDVLGEMARNYGSYIVCGVSETHPTVPGTLCNSAVLFTPVGNIAGVYRKSHIPMAEKPYFYAGNSADVMSTDLGNIGIVICADNSYPELARVLSLKGAEIICVPYCRPRELAADPDAICHLTSCRALENSNFFIAAHRI